MSSWVVPRKRQEFSSHEGWKLLFSVSDFVGKESVKFLGKEKCMKRTHYAGALRESDMGVSATVMGWIENRRDMGGIIFMDLRDREGTLQVVLDSGTIPMQEFDMISHLRLESVIAVSGVIRRRSADTLHPRLLTGTIELKADHIEVLSRAEALPYPLEEGEAIREELRLRYRYLDLRRPKLQRNLRLRHKIQKAAENFLDAHGFDYVETPMLTKSTPEGARDYLVPSRVHPGAFYALPQSPQIFKQLLMVGGMVRYYQIARCFRDEDLRADRQPEFTQVDMELSFVEQEDVLNLLEELFAFIFKEVMGLTIGKIPRMPWKEAMDSYGSDKPDLRFGLPIVDLTDIAEHCGFSVFSNAVEQGGVVRAINVKGKADFTRGEIEELTRVAMRAGAKGMAWIAVKQDGSLYSILTRYISEETMQRLLNRLKAEPGDFILFGADRLKDVRRVLGTVRLYLGDLLGLRTEGDYKLLFVTDFPEFEYSEEEKRFIAMHHPFTMPCVEDIPYMLSDPERVRAQAYDVVLNGIELGSGSIRIHRPEIQALMFKALGFSEEEAQERFGFLLNAFRYGTPPHGGFAFGLDRLTMILAGASSLRDVIAFPKVKDASCLMTDAPSKVGEEQLAVLKLARQAGDRRAPVRHAQSMGTGGIDIDHVAGLARLTFTEEEKRELTGQLTSIIGFADRLAALDTKGISPESQLEKRENVFREDEEGVSLAAEQALRGAKTHTEEYIYVPAVLE